MEKVGNIYDEKIYDRKVFRNEKNDNIPEVSTRLRKKKYAHEKEEQGEVNQRQASI